MFIIFEHADAITHTLFTKAGIIIDIRIHFYKNKPVFAFATTSCSKGSDDNGDDNNNSPGR